MRKLREIIMYGDSEPLEIILSFIMISQLCYPSYSIFCMSSIEINDNYYYIGIASSFGLFLGNILNSIAIRKWSANVSFIVVLSIFILSISNNIYNIQMHLIFVSELIALFWITWRCSREEVSKLMRLIKHKY
jgi:hypothetical protein